MLIENDLAGAGLKNIMNEVTTTHLYYHAHLGVSTRKMQLYSYGYIVNLWLTSQKFSARIGVELKIPSVPIKKKISSLEEIGLWMIYPLIFG